MGSVVVVGRKKTKPQGATPAIAALTQAGLAFTPHPYHHDPQSELGYGMEAVAALGVPASRVFKTLMTEIDGTLTAAIIPVDSWVSMKALAHAVGSKKATMATVPIAEKATGYVVGGISPLGQRNIHPTVLDVSAREHETIFVSGGRRGLDIELAPSDLVSLTSAVVAPIAAA